MAPFVVALLHSCNTVSLCSFCVKCHLSIDMPPPCHAPQYDCEGQSMYYITKSATLFMAIITFPKSWVLGETDTGTMYETHAFWSDDKLQDVYFVDVAYKKLLQNLRSR